VKDSTLHSKRASLTILTSLTQPNPICLTYREQSNTQWDFLHFVIYCLVKQHLVNGDFLIMDNASVHGGSESIAILDKLLQAHGVNLMYLPKYSPELNPCELVFNVVKNHVRNHRDHNRPIWFDIAKGIANITQDKMESFYFHCLWHGNIRNKMEYIK